MVKVIDNAYRQYIRSRPAAATESIKRAKQLDLSNIGTSVLCLVLYEYTQPCNRLLSSPVRVHLHINLRPPITGCLIRVHKTMRLLCRVLYECISPVVAWSELSAVLYEYVGSCGHRLHVVISPVRIHIILRLPALSCVQSPI